MKYRLTDETIKVDEVILHRIECVEAFPNVKAGDKGGWIEKEDNLSQKGYAWVRDDAKVYGNAWVYGNAQVLGNAEVYSNARVLDNAKVYDDAKVFGHAWIYENAKVYGNAHVFDNVWVHGNAHVYDNANVYDNVHIFDDAEVCDNAVVKGYAHIRGNAKISQTSDYIVFQNNFSSGRYFTWTRSNNMWTVGCFHGTGEKLIEKARQDSEEKARCYALYVKLVEDLQKVNDANNDNPSI